MAVCGKKGIFAVFRKRNNQTMLLSVIETAETLGCSAQYVRKLLREGRLAGQKIGDSWILNDDTLESFDRKDLRMKRTQAVQQNYVYKFWHHVTGYVQFQFDRIAS